MENSSTVLVIDDNPVNIKVVANILKKNGMNVIVTLDGKKGIEMAKAKIPNLILLDIQMPEMDGFEVFEKIKETEELCGIPIIFLTARNDDETIKRVFEIGAADYLQKPFSEMELIARTNTQLKLKSSELKLKEALINTEKANQAKSDFLANMSHEIRTPLNSIIGYSEILLEEESDFKKLEKLNTVVTSGKHLMGIISDILDFSKIEAGKLEFDYRPFSIKELFEKMREMFELVRKKKSIKFNIVGAEHFPDMVIGDEQKIEQVLINIINNAFKFTEKGDITLEAEYKDSIAIINITDTGIGIPQDKQDRLFSAFQQAESDISRKYGGTGLGLAISKSIIRMMGGEIEFESIEGEGTTFKIYFPMPWIDEKLEKVHEVDMVENWIKKNNGSCDTVINAINLAGNIVKELEEKIEKGDNQEINYVADNAKRFFERFYMKEFSQKIEEIYLESKIRDMNIEKIKESIKEIKEIFALIPDKYKVIGMEKENETDEKQGFNILIADDVEDNRKLIKLILEKIGFKIEEAENGLEVMEKLRGKNYNLLLLDVQMPYMDGLKTIKAIREKREYDRLHVIALTAQAGTKERDEMNEAGCNGYITKPIDKKKLREEILTVYNGHKISSTERGEK